VALILWTDIFGISTTLNESSSTFNAVCKRLDRRKLTKVPSDNELNTPERLIVVPGLFHKDIESLKEKVLHHTDLIDHQHIGLVKTFPNLFLVGNLSKLVQGEPMGFWCPSCILVGRLAIDIKSCNARWCNNANMLFLRGELTSESFQNGGLSDSSGPCVEDIPAALDDFSDYINLLFAKSGLRVGRNVVDKLIRPGLCSKGPIINTRTMINISYESQTGFYRLRPRVRILILCVNIPIPRFDRFSSREAFVLDIRYPIDPF